MLHYFEHGKGVVLDPTLLIAMINIKLVEIYLSSIITKMAINVSYCLGKGFTVQVLSSDEHVQSSRPPEIRL